MGFHYILNPPPPSYNRILLISVIISILRKNYVYLPHSTHLNAYMRAFNLITRYIMAIVIYGSPSRTLLLKQEIS